MAMELTAGRGRKQSNLLLPLALGHCANDLAPVGMYLIIPAFGAAMGLSPVEIGLLFTIQSLGSAAAFFPAGLMTDHVSHRGGLLLSTFFWVGLGYLAASFSSDFWTFAILITIAGAGDAAWHPMATSVLANLHGQRKAYAIGIHALGGFMAEVVGLIFTGYLLNLMDWSTTLQILVIPTLVVGVAFIFVARRVPRTLATRPTRTDLSQIWRTWASRSGARTVCLFVVYNMAFCAVIAMTPVFLTREHGFDWQETALALAAMMVLGALLQPALGRLSDRVGRRPLIVLGNAASAAGGVAAWASTSLMVTLVSLGVALTS